METLLIASIASAVASFLASRVWGSGTLISAAVTPVVVALVSESLRRPVHAVADTARKLPSVPGAKDADGASQGPGGEPVPADPSRSAATGTQAEARGHPQWRWAVVTGLLAFAIVVAIFTVPDLLAGRSITGDGQPTTFFGGSSSTKAHETSTTTTTTATATTATTPTTTITRTASTTSTATTSLGGASRTSETTTPTTTTSASASSSTSTSTSTTSATGGAVPSPAGATTPAP